jgi:hypothetical protein
MNIGFNPNYPALHMLEALKLIANGKADSFGWDAEDIASVIVQANTLIAERSKSLTQHELSEIKTLINLVKEAA